jgi:hypothetical protein
VNILVRHCPEGPPLRTSVPEIVKKSGYNTYNRSYRPHSDSTHILPPTLMLTRRPESAPETGLRPLADFGQAMMPGNVSLLTISRTFNFLFKVLFTFPSRYLFAIGLSLIFSLRRNLPPILGCIPKQPDSSKTSRRGQGESSQAATGLSPSMVPHSRGLYQLALPRECFHKLQFGA